MTTDDPTNASLDDPYALLGVAKTATQDELKKAYRKLARKLHPDLNPGDDTATDRFKRMSAAYDLLKDPEKRRRFDAGEIDASGHETPQAHPHGQGDQRYYRDFADKQGGWRYRSTSGHEDFEDVSDIFADLFRRQGAQAGGAHPGASAGGRGFSARGADVRYRLEVEFLEAALGAKKRITTPEGRTLDITIPEGLADGRVMRLRGEGGPGFGDGPSGDAYVEVAVRPHKLFSRDGDDIQLELPIGIDEAALGAKVEIPTLAGRVAMTVPKGASSGQTLRLRGKGVKRLDGQGQGDLLVRLKIVMPPEVDDELAQALEKWRERHRYDPRAELWSKT